MRLLSLLFFLLVYFNITAIGQVIDLDKTINNRNLGKYVQYFEDKGARTTLEQIKEIDKKGEFKPGKADILNFGNSKSAFWIKICYSSKRATTKYLLLDVPNIEHIDSYIPSANGLKHSSVGSIVPAQPGIITTNKYVFNLPAQTENLTETTLWLRLKTNNILLVPIKMGVTETFIPSTSTKDYLEIIYLGILLTLFIFHIFLFFSLKDTTYLYYSAYVLSMGIYVGFYLRGYAYLLGDDFRIALNLHPHVFLSIAIIVSILFSNQFLNLRAISSKLRKTGFFIIFFSAIMFFSSLAGYKSLSASLAQGISLVVSVLLLASGIIAYQRGHKPAKYYVLAWSFISITTIMVVLSMEGILEHRDYSFDFVPIGSTIELLLLAFALGDRYRTIMRNEQIVRDENFALIQTQNQRLEKLVEDRTLKLSETIQQLEASNHVKNKLFSIIAHDLRSPFNSLVSIFSLKDMDLLTHEELKMLLNENRKNIDTIHNTLNNLLYWAKSQMEGIKTQPSTFNVKLLIEDLVLVYSPLIQAKGISINLQGAANHSTVYADENQIQLVMRNLIDNAIKFTPPSHSIGINLIAKQNQVEICVSNTVSNTNTLESLDNPQFIETTAGTGHEKGIGLGLHLCRDYIKGNGSELHVSITGRLVSFYFGLPLVPSENTIPA